MIVMKFGGSSVANQEQIDKVLAIVRGRRARRPVVVSSAHKGITDALVNAARSAARGDLDAETVIARQTAIAQSLGCQTDLLAPLYQEIRDLLRGIQLVKELSPRSLDYISSFGERMSVRCIADYFTRQGLAAQAHDVWDLGFITDDAFGRARPLEGYEAGVAAAFAALDPEVVPIVTGFIGKNEAGEITTVGRNGSDLTATLLGGALGAEEVEIWTDTDGVMTADPSLVSGARNIPQMQFDEAAELAYFGSRVLHPSTLVPAIAKQIPVRVLNTNRPDHPGTVIHQEVTAGTSQVTSIAYKERQIVINLRSTRMFGAAGFLSKVFAVCAERGLVIDVVTTSEVSISITANDAAAVRAARPALEAIAEVEVLENRTILAVVGRHLARQAGLGARILVAIADAGVNVEMISFASGAINMTMVIEDAAIDRAVTTLHRVLFES
ncbi:MAG: aspartate kinase [Myxococcales bacterium]|nr:aspartate kinase [Myxococcales bacterium]